MSAKNKFVFLITTSCLFLTVHSAFAFSEEAPNSNANTVVVADEMVDNASEVHDSYFNSNSFGRAWVETIVHRNEAYELPDYSRTYLVNGLSYDQQRKQVVYETNGQAYDCADMDPPRWYRWASKLIPTGECHLAAKIENRLVDNGYEKVRVPFLHVEMVVKTGGNSMTGE